MTNHQVKISSTPGRTISIDQKNYLYFSGTSYLGIGRQPGFLSLLQDGLEKYGGIYSVSRSNNIQLDIYSDVEHYLASVNSAESALTVSSGLLAGQLVMQLFENHRIIYAPGAHPAIWQKSKILHDFSDFYQFNEGLSDFVSGLDGQIVVCANTIDPLKCITMSFDWVSKLPKDKNITMVFDDSHALGVYNYNTAFDGTMHGKGSYEYIRSLVPAYIKVIVISSMAKASAIPGGVILSDSDVINRIRSMPMFAGASPIPPAYLYAFLKAKDVYDDAVETLASNINLFMSYGSNFITSLRHLTCYPVFYSPNNDIYSMLKDENIIISSFPYPDHDSVPITRIVLSALHTREDILKLCEVLANVYRRT